MSSSSCSSGGRAVRRERSPLLVGGRGPRSYGAVLPYLIKAATVKTLNRSDSMASLCYRSITRFVQEDDLPGLRAYFEGGGGVPARPIAVDERDESGATALMLAAKDGKEGFVRELISRGAEPGLQDGDGWTALLCAARAGHTQICRILLDQHVDLEHRDMGGWTALMWASYKGHGDTAVLLLERGADMNAHGNFHVSSLIWAAGRGHSRIVSELVRRGAKVNVGDKYGTTALIWACRKGHTDIVDTLLQAGANVDTAGMYSWTAVLVATQAGHAEAVRLLLERRPNVNALDKDGCTALTLACKEGHHEIAVALLAAGAYVNVQDRAGDTGLIHAVRGGHRAIVEALLKRHADLDVCGRDRKTAIYTAVEKCNAGMVRVLLAAGPDLEIPTRDGDVPLLRAVRLRNAEIVQLLLDRRAKVNAADRRGDTALHIAMRARSRAIVEMLLRDPKHSQLLYRPNKQGETPYNIDLGHQKQILGQVFGARRLNTNEDNETMLGYDLYSSALADMLSEPSLSMPITVGLYAKWGSGKSFLLTKLREEMKNFARQWAEPTFQFGALLLLVIIHMSAVVGTFAGATALSWFWGLISAVTFFALTYVFLIACWGLHRQYGWEWCYGVLASVGRRLDSMSLVLQVAFCHPPAASGGDAVAALPIKFYFSDQARVGSTTGGENSVVQMIGSLYDAIESDYGAFPTRLYRAFRPKPSESTKTWRLRRMCCVPYVIIFEFCFVCVLVGVCALTVYLVPAKRGQIERSQPNTVEDVGILTVEIVLLTLALILGLMFVANVYTWARIFASLVFSQRRQLRRAIAKLDTLKSEGFQQALRQEVALMRDMVKCLDVLNGQQTRLVVVVDGLDSCEQDKVLLVLDAVHMLFSEVNSPFIVILAIDPHVISKAVEVNSRRLFTESNIGGHDYLRNLVHLPFYLQNSGLRRVRVAQVTARGSHRNGNYDDDGGLTFGSALARSQSSRRLSTESGLMSSSERLKAPPNAVQARKGSRKLKLSESVASSMGSNLNMTSGAHDLTKMLLTDDYFSDVNPRSMRRLMNVVYVTGRLLKAFQIDFNWYHLASWVNITEQWPYRTSWIILQHELHEDKLDDGTSLKAVYDEVRPRIPTLKEIEPLLELDRDERKFDVFLTFHRSSLLVSDLKIFLPFAINLDPYIKKVIKEEHNNVDDEKAAQWSSPQPWNMQPKVNPNRRQKLYSRGSPSQAGAPQIMYPQAHANMMGWPQSWMETPSYRPQQMALSAVTNLPADILDLKLSTLSVTDVCRLFEKIEDLDADTLSKYKSVVRKNNINGRVLLHCELDELKKVLRMSFGDWEMFRVLIVSLREHELTLVCRQDEAKNVRFSEQATSARERKSSNPKVAEKEPKLLVEQKSRSSSKQSIMEKQVTLEDQMICGALQTLNEEACEDVLEETSVDDIPELEEPMVPPSTSLIPPSPDAQGADPPVEYRSRTSSTSGLGDADFVLLQTNPFNRWHAVGISSKDGSHSENSSVCSTPQAKRKNDVHIFTQTSTETKPQPDTVITIDLKPIIKDARHHKTVHIQELHRSSSAKNVTQTTNGPQRPSSLLVENAQRGVCTRSKSVEDNKKQFVKMKLVYESPSQLREKILIDECVRALDSDDESTPLVSDMSTPSSPPFRNGQSPQTPVLHPSDNKTDSTDFSPVTPLQNAGHAERSQSLSQSPLYRTLCDNGYEMSHVRSPKCLRSEPNLTHSPCSEPSPRSVSTDSQSLFTSNTVSSSNVSRTSSETSLTNYLEPEAYVYSSNGSVNSLGRSRRTMSSCSVLSRQNALEFEENVDVTDN